MALHVDDVVRRYLTTYDELATNHQLQNREDADELRPHIAAAIVTTLAVQSMAEITECNVIKWVYRGLDKEEPSTEAILQIRLRK